MAKMASDAADYLLEVLGSAKTPKGRSVPSTAKLRELINAGLPYSSLEFVRERLELSVPEAATLLRVPPRTLARRKAGGRLAADESDRLYRLARIASHAVAVFGDEAKAVAWLRRPNRALGHETPIGLLDTDIGTRQVEDALGRIEHGVIG
jgi:putative toxin-antitoxin system antitoxin component (TIGR02293 family)